MNRKLLIPAILGLLFVALFAQTAMAQTICQLGDKGESVRIVQLRLKTLGYTEDAPVSPYLFTQKTKETVKLFQTASGLTSNGVVDEITYGQLTASTAVKYETYVEAQKDAQHVPGGFGPYVLETKTRLKALGYLKGTLNKAYDQAMQNAVSLFQKINSLEQTGIADKITRDRIFSSDAVAYSEASGGDTTTVKLGSKGAQVKTVQTQLSDIGYFTDPINGVFGKSTQTAVGRFQDANNLTGSGIADEATRLILNAGTGKHFETYKAEQTVCQVAVGDKGFSVELLQERLKALYYYSGPINGSFTLAVKDSVMRFQNCNGVNKSGTGYHGIATNATRVAMNAANVVDRVSGEGLFPGDNMPAVTEMTARLRALGYLKNATSAYNALVKKAVAMFQKANKLTVSGKATTLTLERMNSSDAVSYSEYKNGSGNAKIEQMIALSSKLLGRPYKNDCNPPDSFDCSRFTRYVYARVGIDMSGEVEAQAKGMAAKYGKITDMKALKRGDLLFFDTQTDKNPGHSAIYLGVVNGKPCFVHASSAAGKVAVTEFHDWYQKRFEWGVRVFK